jgi:hypothetical protein
MAYNIVPPSDSEQYECLEITRIGGLNTRDQALSLGPDEFTELKNVFTEGRGFEKRLGLADFGTEQGSSDKVVGLGFYEDDTNGIIPLMTAGQTLSKYVSSAWAASDKTDYTDALNTQIVPFHSKSGSSLANGTSTAGSTSYQIEDSGAAWTEGQYQGFCVVIEGEVKYIADNDATTLILQDKLNSDTDSDYQSKAYNIHAVAPHAFIMNGTDHIEKYDLTTTTEIDGTHVTGGKALPIASVGATHHGRMWLAAGAGDDNDRLFITDEGMGENITTDTNLNINIQFENDGDSVVAIGSAPLSTGAVMVSAKKRSVHLTEGDNILNYTTRPIIRGDGCIAQKSFAVGRGTAFMLGEKGVFSIADLGTAPLNDALPISRDIQPTIDALTDAQKVDACGAVHDNKYWLAIGGKMWYYDMEESLIQNKHVWCDASVDAVNFNIMKVIDNKLYVGDDTKGQVYQFLTGNQDDGENIEMVVSSGRFSLPSRPHMWIDRIEIMAEKQTSTVLSMQHGIDGAALGTITNKTLSNDNNRYVFNINKRCYDFTWKMTETGSNTAARIYYPIRIFFARGETGEDGSKG